MKVTLRALPAETILSTIFPLTQYAFHPSPPFEDKEEWMNRVKERENVSCHAVFEDETAMAVASSRPMTQNIRGKLFPASGIWGVATHPAARRKGYCRQAVCSLLKANRDDGNAFSNLYPFRESFYERLGYVTFPAVKLIHLSPASLAPLLKIKEEGEIDLKMIGEAIDTYREFIKEIRLSQHGMAFFDAVDQGAISRNNLWVAAARFDGKVEGVMVYHISGEEITRFKFNAVRFYTHTSRARYLLLNWIARHVDQTDRVEIRLRPDEYPETWLSDIQIKLDNTDRPGMGRVLDVSRIGGMMVGQGSFSARISDPACPWNEGCWRFEGRNGLLEVSPASDADCQLTIQGLTALVLGAHDLQDLPLRGWGDPSPELQVVMRRLFPPAVPYLHENF